MMGATNPVSCLYPLCPQFLPPPPPLQCGDRLQRESLLLMDILIEITFLLHTESSYSYPRCNCNYSLCIDIVMLRVGIGPYTHPRFWMGVTLIVIGLYLI